MNGLVVGQPHMRPEHFERHGCVRWVWRRCRLPAWEPARERRSGRREEANSSSWGRRRPLPETPCLAAVRRASTIPCTVRVGRALGRRGAAVRHWHEPAAAAGRHWHLPTCGHNQASLLETQLRVACDAYLVWRAEAIRWTHATNRRRRVVAAGVCESDALVWRSWSPVTYSFMI